VTDDLNREIVTRAAEDARDQRAHRLLYLAFALAVVGIGALGWLYVSQSQHALEQDQLIARLVDTGNDSAKQGQQLASQVRALGATPVVQPAQPAPAGPTIVTPMPIPGPGPTQAQIDDAVTEYIAAHPPAAGKPATPEMVATAVAEYLTAHPPTPGRLPTPQEIATAATDYLTAHSAQFTGPAGAAGAAGKDATDAQVAAAVDAYCSAHNKCAGPAGPAGQPGQQGKTGATGATGPAGPTCPTGYELRDAVITSPDGSTYRGKACVDPSTSKPPGPITVR
jgi:hypothetical protein